MEHMLGTGINTLVSGFEPFFLYNVLVQIFL